jgi:hypothetical protein
MIENETVPSEENAKMNKGPEARQRRPPHRDAVEATQRDHFDDT